MPPHHYIPFLEKVLTPERLDHSINVMHVMAELSGVYKLDREIAQTVGILHDAGKDLPLDQQIQLMDEGNIPTYHSCDMDYHFYMHGPVGAYLVQKELGITDERVLDAIATHTYYGNSKHFDDPLSWCVRFSDIIEPTRDWSKEKIMLECSIRLRELAYAGHMAQGALLQTESIITWFGEKGFPVHPNMERIARELSLQL